VVSETTSSNIDCISIQNATVTGNVTNASPFVVAPTGISNGVLVNNASIGGSVINAGTIAAPGNWAIYLFNASIAGGVSNSGTISANSGIFLATSSFSGGITNSGSIAAGGTGVSVVNVSTFAGGITNSGTISAGGTGINVFVGTFTGGIANSGTIAAQSSGISVAASTFTGGVTNSGRISAGDTGININSTGTFAGGLTNTGTIAARYSGISISTPTFSGGITNSGTISAGGAGININRAATFAGGITNAGTIAARYGGISVFNVSTFTGGVTNAGTIAAQDGIIVGSTSFSGGIANHGTISAATGIEVFTPGTFAGGISNSGTISSPTGGAGIALGGVGQFSGGIGNSGTITTAGTGIEVFASTFAGGITNSNGGTISAGNGIAVGSTTQFGGGIGNAGAVHASSGIGVSVANSASFSGGIANSGTIAAAKSGINVSTTTSFSGGISNSGTIASLSELRAGIALVNVSQFSGGIGNAGTITTAGAGIKVIVASFAGGITNSSGGVISAGNGVAVGNVKQFGGGISNGGRITSNKTGIFVGQISGFSGNIGNTGTISAATGIHVGSGVSFAAASAIVNSGTITGSAAAIDVRPATSSVTIDQTGGAINGAIKLSSNADVLNISGGTINGNIVGAGAHDTVNFAPGAGNSFTYASSFTGIEQVNINSGTVVLNGSNAAANLDVNGGTLAGTGIIDPLAVTIHSGATLQPGTPGSAGGRLSLVGSLVFQSAAVYLVTINGSSASYAAVTGTASLGGAQVSIASDSQVIPRQKYTILTDTGGGLGGSNSFAGSVDYGRLRGTLSYDANDVYVTFQWPTLGPLLPANAPANISHTAAAIDGFISGGGNPPTAWQNLYNLSPAELSGALPQLSGEAATGRERTAFAMTSAFLNLMLDPFVDGRGGNEAGGPALGFAADERAKLRGEVARAYAAVPGDAAPASFEQRWSAWGAAYGGSSNSGGDPAMAGSHAITASAFGFAGGIDDHLTPSTLAGVALAGGGTNWGLAGGLGSGRSDALQVGGHGISWFGPAYIAAALSFSNHWFATNRVALGDQLTANFIGQSYGARFEAGYRHGVWPTLAVTPYGAVQVQRLHTPTYRENAGAGSDFALAYAAMNATDIRTELGARFDAPTMLDDRPLTLYGRAAWAHDFVSNPAFGAAFATLPGSSFTVYGAPIPHDTALTTVGAQLSLSANWSMTGAFNGDFAPGSQSYGGNGKLRYTW
jgi:uncharacterized protein with beta-barrel porin domain